MPPQFVQPVIGQDSPEGARTIDGVERRLRVPHKTVTTIIPTGTRTTASGSYVDYAAATADVCQVVGFVKYRDDTKIVLGAWMAAFMTASTGITFLGINLNAVDYNIAKRASAAISTAFTIGGMLEVSGIPKGTYTITLRWATSAGTLNADGNEMTSMVVEETF